MKKFIVFECPLHGEETEAFCWRAFQKEHKNNWTVYISHESRSLTEKEYSKVIIHLTKGDRK